MRGLRQSSLARFGLRVRSYDRDEKSSRVEQSEKISVKLCCKTKTKPKLEEPTNVVKGNAQTDPEEGAVEKSRRGAPESSEWRQGAPELLRHRICGRHSPSAVFDAGRGHLIVMG